MTSAKFWDFLTPSVRIWDWSTVLNSRNLPYYIFFWANPPSPLSADVIYGCPPVYKTRWDSPRCCQCLEDTRQVITKQRSPLLSDKVTIVVLSSSSKESNQIYTELDWKACTWLRDFLPIFVEMADRQTAAGLTPLAVLWREISNTCKPFSLTSGLLNRSPQWISPSNPQDEVPPVPRRVGVGRSRLAAPPGRGGPRSLGDVHRHRYGRQQGWVRYK